MAATPTDDLLERLKDPEYAKLYGEENAKVDFAITLTKARKSLNITQRSLAEKLGISQPYVAKLEGGEANPTLGTIGRLLAAISLRLVTGTAPLMPEPVRPAHGFVWIGAADAASLRWYFEIHGGVQEISLVSSPYTTMPVNTGAMAGTIPIWPVKSEPGEVLVGGAAK
jgi:transcriptional regulator with XRE-family HTH domain